MRSKTLGVATVLVMTAGLLIATPAGANLFTHILRDAGEAGGKAAGHASPHLGAVGKAASHLKGLAGAPKGALAAHATPEGHWQFVNREGQVYTAGTADEMKRVLPTLSPDIATGESKFALYLSEDSVFQNRAALDQLPKDANLHVVTDGGAFSITRTGAGSGATLKAKIKSNISIELVDQALFDEAILYLGRPLNKANIRTIGFEPGAAKRLPSAPKLDAVTKTPLVDQLDPEFLASAFGAMRGQTALVVGRIENGKVFFMPSKAPEIGRDIDELVGAAAQSDVNLIVLHTDAGRQPGGLNWLWQSIEVGGFNDATKAANFGDFLDALAARRGGFEIAATTEGGGRVQILAKPTSVDGGMAAEATSLLEETVSHLTGEIVTKAVEMHGRDQSAQSEMDARWIPGIPTYIQIPYVISLIAGIVGWATLRAWWNRIWPALQTVPGSSRVRSAFRQLPRELIFWTAFLPIAGVPAVIWQLAVQTWQTATAPFRWIYRRFLRREI